MKNMVPCKACAKNFEYIPGPAGNARQLCEACRSVMDEAELKRFEEDSIKEGNRYLADKPDRKHEYDAIDILIDGNMPEFETDADKFICATEIAYFLRRQKGGFCGMEKRIAELLEHLGITHSVLLVKQWTLQMMERAAKHPDLAPIMSKLATAAAGPQMKWVEDSPGHWVHKKSW